MDTKVCTKCKIEKTVDLFVKSSRNLSGFAARCKLCVKTSSKQYRDDNIDKVKETERRSQLKHRDKINARRREADRKRRAEYLASLPTPEPITELCCLKCEETKPLSEFKKSSRAKLGVTRTCKLCHNKSNREYVAENKEKVYARIQEWKSKNKARTSETNRAWNVANRKLKAAYEAQRRAVKLQATPSWADLDAIKAFYENCPEGYEVDHIHPLQGRNICGLHTLENLQYLTIGENRSKSNKF